MGGSLGPICVNVIDPDQLFFDSSRDVAMATILGKIGETTFIRHPSILKRIGISQYFIAPMILLHRVQIYLIIYNDSRRVHAVQIQSRPYRARQ